MKTKLTARKEGTMNEYDMCVRLSDINKNINIIRESIDKLSKVIKSDEDLWDNADIIRHWKVSERTLADWRKKGLISFVQVNGKIWYPRKAREEFLSNNLIISKDGR